MNDTPSAPRRLYRSNRDKVIGGVCGGLGGYLNIDPVIIRIVWLALLLVGGTGLLAYIIAWILIPEAPDAERDAGQVDRPRDTGRIAGIVLIVLALLWLGNMIGLYSVQHIPWHWLGPLGLVALGVALLLRKGVHDAAEQTETGHTPPATAPPNTTPVEKETAEPDPAPAEDPPAPDADEPAGSSDADSDEDKKDDSSSAGEDSRPFERRPLRRSVTDKVVAGVCGGLARYFGFDSTAMRLLFALVGLASVGLGVIAYLVLWVAIKEEEW